MRTYFLLSVLLVFGLKVSAHSPDNSTAFLAEQDGGEWIVQLNTALTAFEHEIHYNYSDSAYSTPEEFRQLVVEYCKANFILVANGSDTLSYANVAVRLGHATDVVFQVANMPASLSELTVINRVFQDIGRSNSTFVMLKKGYPKAQASLTKNNGFTETFEVGSDTIEISRPSALASVGTFTWVVAGVLIAVLVGGFLIGNKSVT